MSNKVTNIYIDTTGFCDEAVERAKKAFDAIVDYNKMENIFPTQTSCAGDNVVIYINEHGCWYYADRTSPNLDSKNSIGLWELESIAFRCKHEKKEESLPTRNIYIDARKLTQEQRLCAYQALGGVAFGRETGWLPDGLADGANHHEALILFDIFAIDSDGHRRFYSGDYINKIYDHLQKPKELSCDQLMSLAR